MLPPSAFTQALVRPPPASFDRAYRSSRQPIDVPLARAQHAEYCQALAAAGLAVTALPADDAFPDGCFVQDPALLVPLPAGQGHPNGDRLVAIITRPALASRQGETAALSGFLGSRFRLHAITPPGTLEGGDVMLLPGRVLVGRSGRTNRQGIAQLAALLAPVGLPVEAVAVPAHLHLLTAATYLGRGLLLAQDNGAGSSFLAGHPAVTGLELLSVPAAEAYAANVLGIGDSVIMPAGYPAVESLLRRRGFRPLPVPMSEFCKADGGVTCLSLLW
jgi:dimethylargininase